MTDQNTFMETVRNVADIIRTAAEPMPEEEILSYFEEMELTDEQKRLVMGYLMNPESTEEDEGIENEENGSEEKADGEAHFTQSKVFKMYLEELSLLPEYTQEETEDLYRRLLQGEKNVIETISTVWLKKVLIIAEKYLMQGLHVEDLVQEGNMALFLKLQELCGTGADVDTEGLLEQAVEEGIMLYASEMNGERELENTILGKMSLVHEAKKILREEKGDEPTMAELSEYTKIPENELSDLEDILSPAKG
ncbi:MAG: hypothetical protein HFJ06_02110 [Lachnospiraceae bacterium]|nr:hypothetical protein [Lachnospiraceae bacterium]